MLIFVFCVLVVLILIAYLAIGAIEKRLRSLETAFIALHEVKISQDIIDKSEKRFLN